jgi:hypothetical protein
MQELRITELELRAPDGGGIGLALPDTVARSFLAWQLEGAFDYALQLPRAGGWVDRLTRPAAPFPSVCLGIEAGRAALLELERSAMRGFELLVVTRSSADACREFLATFGYDVTTELRGSTDDLRAICPYWDRSGGLDRSLAVASRLGWAVAVGFGHDADPIYVLAAGQPSAGSGASGSGVGHSEKSR